jgi:hypothetical protein
MCNPTELVTPKKAKQKKKTASKNKKQKNNPATVGVIP